VEWRPRGGQGEGGERDSGQGGSRGGGPRESVEGRAERESWGAVHRGRAKRGGDRKESTGRDSKRAEMKEEERAEGGIQGDPLLACPARFPATRLLIPSAALLSRLPHRPYCPHPHRR
jgi:hypothetical protein